MDRQDAVVNVGNNLVGKQLVLGRALAVLKDGFPGIAVLGF
jgi:hypothetical protein